MNSERNEILNSMALAFGALKSAVFNINIGEGIEGCEQVVEVSQDIGLKQIQRIRKSLASLKPLITPKSKGKQ